ncbi:MAG: hypothetical protein AMXMBFR34_40760 [Myxococcaceae bacterium]
MRRLLVASALLLCGCKAAEVTGPGAAGFRDVPVATPTGPIDSLFAVCWPLDALAGQRVALTFLDDGDVAFATTGGASNSSARCLREIASTWPWKERPKAPVTVAPPTQPIDGWGTLAWVRLLSPARYGPERGLVDPAPLVRACIDRGGGPGPSLRFTVEAAMVKPGFVGTEAGRCVEAVLGSTAWPSSRDVFFEFATLKGAPEATGDVSPYFAPPGSVGALLDPQAVRETIRAAGPKVSACWNAALERRAGLGGGRSFRFQTNDAGQVTHAWVQGNLADGPAAADYLLDRCLADVLRGLRFGGLAGEGMYTWVFAARG